MQGPGKVLFPQVGGSLSGVLTHLAPRNHLPRQGGGCTQRKEKK